jgi:hypothetical protein
VEAGDRLVVDRRELGRPPPTGSQPGMEDDEREEPDDGQGEERDRERAGLRSQLGPDQRADGEEEGEQSVIRNATRAGGKAVARRDGLRKPCLVPSFGRL